MKKCHPDLTWLRIGTRLFFYTRLTWKLLPGTFITLCCCVRLQVYTKHRTKILVFERASVQKVWCGFLTELLVDAAQQIGYYSSLNGLLLSRIHVCWFHSYLAPYSVLRITFGFSALYQLHLKPVIAIAIDLNYTKIYSENFEKSSWVKKQLCYPLRYAVTHTWLKSLSIE